MPIGPFAEIQPTFEDNLDEQVAGALLDTVPLDSTPERWQLGFSYMPSAQCEAGDTWSPCTDGDWPEVDRTRNLGPVYVAPFEIVVSYQCSSWGMSWDERVARATRTMEQYQGQQLEFELWRGHRAIETHAAMIGGTLDPFVSPFLSNADTLTSLGSGTPTALMYALASLEEAVRGALGDAVPAVIHATPKTVSLWQQGGGLRLDPQGRIRTVLGSYVIAGSGYVEGSGPVTVDPDDGTTTGGTIDTGGDTAWAYGTGPIGILLDEIDPNPTDIAEAMDRSVNDVTAWASRTAAVYFSPCAHFGINVDLCNTSCPS